MVSAVNLGVKLLAALCKNSHADDAFGRAEAVTGLARRNARFVIAVLYSECHRDDFTELVIETAANLTDPRWVPALSHALSNKGESESFMKREIRDAIGPF